ncbi:MAG: type II secretion system minor pseudopilin GspH [Pseudomonadota bacterium]
MRIARAQTLRRASGFTLIEIMIVVFIIGLVTAAAVITFAGDHRDTELDKEAQRLDALLSYVREQAELQTRDYGFRTNADSYSFVVFDVQTNQWHLAEEDDALRAREYPDGIQPAVVVEGRPIVLDEKKKPGLDDFKPQIMIFANGDLSSFEIVLQREGGNDRARIYSDEQTAIRLLLPGEVEQKVPPVRAAARP